MTRGFEVGRVYNRRRDIHERFGGQQQGGIITPANAYLVDEFFEGRDISEVVPVDDDLVGGSYTRALPPC